LLPFTDKSLGVYILDLIGVTLPVVWFTLFIILLYPTYELVADEVAPPCGVIVIFLTEI
jgi:hypothetical protein